MHLRISRCLGRFLAVAASLIAASAPAFAADALRHPRVAAEWEPALGAMVAWPPVVPDALLVEIAKDDRLYVLVEDAEMQAEAAERLETLGVALASVEFIVAEAREVAVLRIVVEETVEFIVIRERSEVIIVPGRNTSTGASTSAWPLSTAFTPIISQVVRIVVVVGAAARSLSLLGHTRNLPRPAHRGSRNVATRGTRVVFRTEGIHGWMRGRATTSF